MIKKTNIMSLILSLWCINSFSMTTSSNLNISVNTLPGCIITMEDVNFGSIGLTQELVDSIEASSPTAESRQLYSIGANLHYNCSKGLLAEITTLGERNLINQSDSQSYLHYDVTYQNFGIHTIPIQIHSDGAPKILQIKFSIMSPSSYGNGIFPKSGVYLDTQDLTILF